MAKESYQLKGNAAGVYEAQKVPAIFRPLALATLDKFPLQQDDKILDLACGTGIVAREILSKLTLSGFIAGVDLNEGMIKIARELTQSEAGRCEWHVADVCKMPFADNVFTAAICQQGIQFFPNEDQALVEIQRVLNPGGRLAITVWAGASVFFKTLADALKKHISKDIADQSLAPFQYAGIKSLPDRMRRLGYAKIEISEISINREIHNPETGIAKEILGNPIGTAVSERGEAVMQAIVEQVIKDLSKYVDGETLSTPQMTHLITAVAL